MSIVDVLCYRALARPERRARLVAHICRLLDGGMYRRLVTKEQARKLIVGTA